MIIRTFQFWIKDINNKESRKGKKKSNEFRHHLQSSPDIYCIVCFRNAYRYSNFGGWFSFSLTYFMFSVLSLHSKLLFKNLAALDNIEFSRIRNTGVAGLRGSGEGLIEL